MVQDKKEKFIADIDEFINLLPGNRSQNVIISRFGLNQKPVLTLEKIGTAYNITRERVRQIENDAIKYLSSRHFKAIDEYINDLYELIKKSGGFMKENSIISDFGRDYLNISAQENLSLISGGVVLLLYVASNINLRKEDSLFYNSWYISDKSKDSALNMVKNLISRLEQVNIASSLDSIYDVIKETFPSLEKNHLKYYIDATKAVESNIFNDYGLKYWPEISPKSVKDKIFLIFKKSNSPLHFREAAYLINRSNFSEKPVLAQTVHNELIKDPRFVLIGRGTYALKQWGYEPGTVRELIRSIMSKNGGSMRVDEIVEEASKTKKVERESVLLNLKNFSEFKKIDDNTYTLEL